MHIYRGLIAQLLSFECPDMKRDDRCNLKLKALLVYMYYIARS